MSYSSETKKELTTLKNDNCCAVSELSALLRISGDLIISSEGPRLEYHTTNPVIARRVIVLTKQLYDIDINLVTMKQTKLEKRNIYLVQIKTNVSNILNELSLLDFDMGINTYVPSELVVKDCDKKAYLRGCFLASGSVNNPKTSRYHMEINSPSEDHANQIKDIINEYDLKAKVHVRKKGYITYIKEAEKISDFLRLIGAVNSVLAFEDLRIRRDLNNSINRVINMEIANMNKTIESANKHLEYIAYLEKRVGYKNLSRKMQEAIVLRKENPEASLQELSNISQYRFNKGISKSGLNHRFRMIAELVEEYKKK